MLTRLNGFVLLACALLPSTAAAQTALLWKFVPGQVFEVERIASQKQTVECDGKSFKQNFHSTWNIRLEVQKPLAKGFQIDAMLTRVEQSPAGVDAIDPRLAEKMQGCSFRLLVTPQGKLFELQGYEDFLNKLAGKDKKRLQALQTTFPEATVREIFADLFGPLPEKKVVKGDAWERTYAEPISHFGILRSTVRYVYEGTIDRLDRIDYAVQTKYELPSDEMMVLFRVVKGQIRSDKAQGSIAFDRQTGHLVEHERSMVLGGTLTVESMERKVPLEFRSENHVKIRVKAVQR